MSMNFIAEMIFIAQIFDCFPFVSPFIMHNHKLAAAPLPT